MLSLTSGSLAKALRPSQQLQSTGHSINSRFLATDAGSGGSSGSRSGGRSSGHRGSGGYTFKQAFSQTQGKSSGGGSDHKRATLADNRKASEARFAGASMGGEGPKRNEGQGKYSSMQPRGGPGAEGGEKGGMAMPQDKQREPRTVEQVRSARERLEGRGAGVGQEAPKKAEGMFQHAQSSVNASGRSRLIDADGEDRTFGSPAGEGGQGGRGVGRDRGSNAGFRPAGGRGRGRPDSGLGAPKRKDFVVPTISSFGLEAAAAQERAGMGGRRGRGLGEDEKLGGGVPDLFGESDSSRDTRRFGSARAREARLKELDRLSDEADAAESGTREKEGPQFTADKELAMMDEKDEIGEERLINETVEEEEEETRDMGEIRDWVEVARRVEREYKAEDPLVALLPAYKTPKGESFPYNTQDPALRRAVEMAVPRALTEDELLDADRMEDVLGENMEENQYDLESEQIIMENQFSFGDRTGDVTLHSEKGLLYGVIDTFDRMITEKKRQLIVKARQARRFQIWRAVSWAKRAKKIKERNARKERLRKEAKERWAKNEADPNMFYYPDLNLWFSRAELSNVVFRNSLSAVISNPSWNRTRRREHMIGMQKDLVKLASPLPPHKQLVFDTVWSMPKKPAPTDTRTIEHMLGLPIDDWSLMLAQAERTMDPVDRLRRFDPSPFEKKNNVKL